MYSQSQRRKYNYLQLPSQTQSVLGLSTKKTNNIQQINNQARVVPSCKIDASAQRILQLEKENKCMLEETTKKFKGFQADVAKVESILQSKEKLVASFQQQNRQLIQDKATLIQALEQKELIIQEFQAKLQELISEKLKKSSPVKQKLQIQTESKQVLTDEPVPLVSVQQFEDLQQQLREKATMFEQQRSKSQALNEQVYKLKEQLYEATSELSLTKQEFETFKLLKQIDAVKNM